MQLRIPLITALRRVVLPLTSALALTLALAGCASAPGSAERTIPTRDSLTAFSLEGRFSLRHENKNYSGKLSWLHSGANNTLLLSSPLGQGIAEIATNESGAQLTAQDGQTYTAVDAETLTRQVLGYPLPLAQLTDWVRGRRSKEDSAQLDAFGRLQQLRHQGWRIDYGYASEDPQAPPNRLFAENADGLDLRLLIDEWSSLPNGEAKP